MKTQIRAMRVTALRLTTTLSLALALLAASWSYSPWVGRSNAQASPLSISGMAIQTEGRRLWVWDDHQLHAQVPDTNRMAEVKTLDEAALANVRAVVEAGRSMWIMNPEHVYRHVAGTLEVVEVLNPEGLPIADAGGVMGAAACLANIGGPVMGDSVLIWTSDRLFLGQAASSTTAELLSGSASVPGVTGVAPACPESAWVWTSSMLFRWEKGSRQLVEVRTTGGSAIGGVTSVVTDPEGQTWIVTATKILKGFQGTSFAEEIVDAGGLGLAAANVLVGQLAASTFSGAGPGLVNEGAVWLSTDDHVYRYFRGTDRAAEVLSPSGVPLGEVEGIVAAGLSSEPQPFASQHGEVLLWNTAGVFKDMPGTNRTRQITDPTGAAIAGVRGAVAFSSAASTEWLFWNDSGLFRHLPGTAAADEVLSAEGTALPNIRGVIPTMRDQGSDDLWIWSEAEVYVLRAQTQRAARVQGPAGASLSQAWAVVASGESAWIRTPAGLYQVGPGSTTAAELRTSGGASLPSPTGELLALVVHPQAANHLEIGPWGASLVNPPVPRSVTFAGSLRGGVDVSSVGANGGLTTLTAFTGAIPYIQDAGAATLLRGPAALLFSSGSNPEPTATPTAASTLTPTPTSTPTATPTATANATPTQTATPTPTPVGTPAEAAPTLRLYLPLILKAP